MVLRTKSKYSSPYQLHGSEAWCDEGELKICITADLKDVWGADVFGKI